MDDEKQRELVSALAGISLPMWEKVKSIVDWRFERKRRELALDDADDLCAAFEGKLNHPELRP